MTHDTNIKVMYSEKAYDLEGTDRPDDCAAMVEDFWNNNIKSGGDYEAWVSAVTGNYASLDDPDTKGQALGDAQQDSDVQDFLDVADAILVVDARDNIPANEGVAYTDRAGSDYGVAYVNQWTDDTMPIHELAHVYGCSHSGSNTHYNSYGWWSMDVAGDNSADDDCDGNSSQLLKEKTIKDCAKSRIRRKIDNL